MSQVRGSYYPRSVISVLGCALVDARWWKAPHLLPITLKWLHYPDLSSAPFPVSLFSLFQVAVQCIHRYPDPAMGSGGPGLPHAGCWCEGRLCPGHPCSAGHVRAGQGKCGPDLGLRNDLLDSASQGLPPSLEDWSPVSSPWLYPLLPV